MSVSNSGPSVCVSCMACHNEGRGLGKWITAEQVAAAQVAAGEAAAAASSEKPKVCLCKAR